MKYIVAFLCFLGVAWSFSTGIPPVCDVYASWGCNQFGLKGGVISRLNCTESQPGLMPWTLRPVVGTNLYTFRSGDGAPASDPTSYTPGRLMVLHLRVLNYNYKFRGLLAYARAVSDPRSRVGNWEQPDTDLYWAPWTNGNACQGGLTHTTARIKPFHSLLYFRAPPVGTGPIRFEVLIKQGDANTGAFFYPAVNLTLTEGAAPSEQMYFEAASTSTTCTQECVSRGMTCNAAAQNGLATGGLTAFNTNIAPNYACDHMFAACDVADPLRTVNQDCTYFDATTCPNGVTPTSSCDALLPPTSYSNRFCACQPDPCNPSPCLHGTCSVNTAVPLSESAFTCACDTNFDGPICDRLVASCGAGNAPCLNGATCTPGTPSVTCGCVGAYTGLTCEIPPPCNNNPCRNGGTCLNIDLGGRNFTAQCQCPAGYSGPLCEVIDGCVIATSTCQNGGVCVDNPDDNDPKTSSCNCIFGFVGDFCQTDMDECSLLQHPCSEHGACTNLFGTYTCSCDPGFCGATCGQDQTTGCSWCSPNPCAHGGSCTECVNSTLPACAGKNFLCDCTGYTGTYCENKIDYCNPQPCLNGGRCVDGATTYSCQCAAGYTGSNCETNINDCTRIPGAITCDNGGTCVDGVNTYTCNCLTGWIGADCRTADTITFQCETSADCPTGIECLVDVCDLIGCVSDESCPSGWACTGDDVPDQPQQRYCEEQVVQSSTAFALSLL